MTRDENKLYCSKCRDLVNERIPNNKTNRMEYKSHKKYEIDKGIITCEDCLN